MFMQDLARHIRGGLQEASKSEGARPSASSRGRPAADRGVAPRRCCAERGQNKHIVLRGRPTRGAAGGRRRLQRCRQLLQRRRQLVRCELPLPALLSELLLQLPNAGDWRTFRVAEPAGPLGDAAPRLAVSRWAFSRSATTAATAACGCICIWPLLDGFPRGRRRPEEKEEGRGEGEGGRIEGGGGRRKRRRRKAKEEEEEEEKEGREGEGGGGGEEETSTKTFGETLQLLQGGACIAEERRRPGSRVQLGS